jgi:hypothetical protein
MIRQAELDEAKQAVEEARRKIARDVEDSVDPGGEVKQALTDVKEINAPTPTIAAPAKSATNGSAPPEATGGQPASEGTAAPTPAPGAPEKSA